MSGNTMRTSRLRRYRLPCRLPRPRLQSIAEAGGNRTPDCRRGRGEAIHRTAAIQPQASSHPESQARIEFLEQPSRRAATARRANGSSRHGSQVRWAHSAAKNGHGNGHSKQNGSHANGANGLRKAKPAAARSLHNGHVANGKPAAKSAARPAARRAPVARPGTRPGTRKDARTDARSRRKPALTASAKAGNRTRYGFTAPGRQRSKKRG